MNIICPHCNSTFSADSYMAEEVLHPNIDITRHSIDRASWTSLAQEINSGYAYRVISVGDEIQFALKNGLRISVTAVQDNPYWDNSMAFVLTDALPDPHNMNDTYTTRGGYPATGMRKYLLDKILPQLPDELVSVIKPRKIVQKYGNDTFMCEDKIWLPSYTEMFGNPAQYFKTSEPEDRHFGYFDTEKSRVKMMKNETYWYWLRSAYDSTNFCYVNYYGGNNNYIANTSYGVVFGFLI